MTTNGQIDPAKYILWLVLLTCRKNRGLGQRAAAKKIGVSQPVVAEWESGNSAITEQTLVKVATAYGITVRELLVEGLAPPRPAPEKTPKRRGSKKALAD